MVYRVGIMSMQRILNYGSSLQAYGLRRLIEGVDPDAEVRFVDYRPGPTLVAPEGRRPPRTRFGRSAAKIREYGSIDASWGDRLRFVNHKRAYAARNFPHLGIALTPVHDLPLHVLVIGSDEVFNCVQSNTNVGYSRDLFGHGSSARRLVSYAASFGNTTLEKIEQMGIADELRADLSRFDRLSVRDRNSAHIVQELTGTEPSINVDPVLAHDFMTAEARIPTGRLHDHPYLVVYAYPGRLTAEENSQLRRFADRRGLQVVAFGGPQSCADRFIDCSPFELLAWFRDAEAVVTDTFHGTIFAMINHRPFTTIVRKSSGHGYGNEEKISHLLATFGLLHRAATSLDDLDDLMDVPLDIAQLHTVIAREREKSISYLTAAVERSAQR